MTDAAARIERITGRAVPVRGTDIDTDRIIPARHLRTVTFEDLGTHAFEDERAASAGAHPFDQERFQGATILIGNANFGCGSSREHAPQALMRWGIRAFVAESFAEIFFGNCVSLGLPCLRVSPDDAEQLKHGVEASPGQELSIDLNGPANQFGDQSIEAVIPEGPRVQFLTGAWDVLGQLVEADEQITRTAAQLPYVAGF